QDRPRLVDGQAADQVDDPARLHRRDPHVAGARERTRLVAEHRLAARVHAPAVGGCHQRRRPFLSSLTSTWLHDAGANSPRLRPSCTAIVWPIMSGTIIERRDQVLITLWVPFAFSASTFFIRWSSTKGPFFRLRGISVTSYPCRTCDGG